MKLYIKRFNFFLIMAFTFTFPFILYYMQSVMFENGLQEKVWLVSVTGIFYCIGLILEMVGIKKKEDMK